MDLSSADLATIKSLYADGKYLQALAAGERFGPLKQWGAAAGRLLAGRLAMQLGAPRLGRQLHALAAREYPANLEAIYYAARYRLERFGPFACWRYARTQKDWSDASPDLRADWQSLCAFIAARLRDFESADRLMKKAEELAPNRPWINVERASILEIQERYDEAMEAAVKSCKLHAWFRPGVQAIAHIHLKQNQDEKAVQILQEALHHNESGLIAAQLASIQIDLKQYDQASKTLELYEKLTPMMEKEISQWLNARQSDLAYIAGEREKAIHHARLIDEPFYTKFADKIADPAVSLKKHLDISKTFFGYDASGVPLLNQNSTTYDALSLFWNKPFPNPSGESVLPTDGLPDAEERLRAQANGWLTREFTLSADSAYQLIEAGLPFIITLVEIGISQSRVCVGCDENRGSLFLVDAIEQKPSEAPLDIMLDRFRSSGPRAILYVPMELAERVKPLEHLFTDREVYDALYEVQKPLLENDRRQAGEAAARLSATYPGHRITKLAALSLARYDQHPQKILLAAKECQKDFPEDSTFALTEASAYRELGLHTERQKVFEKLIKQENPDALVLQSCAQTLLTDHRANDRAEMLLRSSVRARVQAAAGYYLLASQAWEQQKFSLATELYRFACCADDREDQFAESYIRVARVMNRSDEAIRLFKYRLQASKEPSFSAIRSYYMALNDRDEIVQAEDLLTAEIEKCKLFIVESNVLTIYQAEQKAKELKDSQHQNVAKIESGLGSIVINAPAKSTATETITSEFKYSLNKKDIVPAKSTATETISSAATSAAISVAVAKATTIETMYTANEPGSFAEQKADVDKEALEKQDSRQVVVQVQDSSDENKNQLNLLEQYKSTLGDLYLFRAEQYASLGKTTESKKDLESAKEYVSKNQWNRSAAKIARLIPDFALAQIHVRKALGIDPSWAEGQRILVSLINDTHGKFAAKEYLGGICNKYPHAYHLQRLRIDFLSGEDDEVAVTATRNLIELCPEDAWAHRQLALLYANMTRIAEANSHVQKAGAIEPTNPSHYAVAAHVARQSDNIDEAITLLKEAIKLNPDFEPVIGELINLSRGRKEKGQSLKYVAEQLRKRPHTGDGLVAYRDAYLSLADDDEAHEKLLERLQKFLDIRPDLWQAWSLVCQQYGIMHRLDESYSLAQEAAERFPLAPKVLLDLAEICRVKELNDERIDALRKAVRAAPTWTPAARELAEALKDENEEDEALAVLERSVQLNSLDPLARGAYADRLWSANRGDEAIAMVESAIRHEPGFEWGWGALAEWSERNGQSGKATELARELTRERSGDPRVWMKLARFLDEPENIAESLNALEKAIVLDQANVDAHDMRAERLAEMSRYDEAIAAAKPPGLAEDWPMVLQGRTAWIHARRGNFTEAIPLMQKLVKKNPDYVWGWHQLAEWFNETNRTDQFLEAATELVRLRPDQAMPLAVRGEAKMQTGDRSGAKDDLREALRISPRYAPAAALLFDICLADNEMRDARSALAVLQEHLEGPEVAVKQIKYAVKADDIEAAMKSFTEICKQDGESFPAIFHVALAEFRDAKWEDRAAAVMKQIAEGEPPFNPLAALFWLDTDAAESATMAEKIALLDKALKAYPTFMHGYDRKAVLLTQERKYDEAIKTCLPENFGQTLPIPLQGRVSWVEAERGNRIEAIKLMTAVLRDSPDYFWGWKMLAQWHEQAGETAEHLRAAEQIVRLAPGDPMALFTRGMARRAAELNADAVEDFRRAFEIDPQFEEAGYQLVGALLAKGLKDEAAETLKKLMEKSDGPLLRLRSVQVACARRDMTTARRFIRLLAEDPETPKTVLLEAVRAFDDEQWPEIATEELESSVSGQNPTANATSVWIERANSRGQTNTADRIAAIGKINPDVAIEGLSAFALSLIDEGKYDQAYELVPRHKELFARDTVSWARAGAIMASCRKYADAIDWMKEWPIKKDLETWMLLPLLDSYHALGLDEQARIVALEGRKSTIIDDTTIQYRGWLALEAALAGKTQEAKAEIDGIDLLGKPDGIKLLYTLIESVVDVSTNTDKSAAFSDAKQDLRVAADSCKQDDLPPGIARWYQAVVSHISKQCGLKAKIWAGWQKIKPWVKEN